MAFVHGNDFCENKGSRIHFVKWERYFETSIIKLECCILSIEHTCVGYSFNSHVHVVAEVCNLMLVGSVSRCIICVHLEILVISGG